jgi:hypothetical protein
MKYRVTIISNPDICHACAELKSYLPTLRQDYPDVEFVIQPKGSLTKLIPYIAFEDVSEAEPRFLGSVGDFGSQEQLRMLFKAYLRGGESCKEL